MGDSRNTVHHGFERDRDLLLDLLGGDSRPLRDDIDIVVRHVRIRFDRKLVERNNPPCKEQDRGRQHQKAVLQRKIDKPPDHCASSVASSWRTSETTR